MNEHQRRRRINVKISEVIQNMKQYHKGDNIQDDTTRDQVLYGNVDQDCSGIVTTCWASIDVILNARAKGANLIICHEALFWNHGDKTQWLLDAKNKAFLEKKRLLDESGIVVWRDHDYIHSGIPIGNGVYSDGIFYGFASMLGWVSYVTSNIEVPLMFELPETTVDDIAKQMLNTFHLEGVKVIGDPHAKVKKVYICAHVMGRGDNELITKVDQEDIDLLISLELIDYTASEYIRDSSMAGNAKAILALGHFNAEEPGMEYMTTYLDEALGESIPHYYVQSGDMYSYITK